MLATVDKVVFQPNIQRLPMNRVGPNIPTPPHPTLVSGDDDIAPVDRRRAAKEGASFAKDALHNIARCTVISLEGGANVIVVVQPIGGHDLDSLPDTPTGTAR